MLTHVEDYSVDYADVFARMQALDTSNLYNTNLFLEIVNLRNPPCAGGGEDAVGEAAHEHVLGQTVGVAVGQRVRMHGDWCCSSLIAPLGLGSVIELHPEGTAVVMWDTGTVHSCRVGLMDEFWLVLAWDL